MVGLRIEVASDAFTADSLGTERRGNGVVIGGRTFRGAHGLGADGQRGHDPTGRARPHLVPAGLEREINEHQGGREHAKAGPVKLVLKPKGRAKKILRQRGKLKATLRMTFKAPERAATVEPEAWTDAAKYICLVMPLRLLD